MTVLVGDGISLRTAAADTEVTPSGQERAHHGCMPILACDGQCCAAVSIDGVQISAGALEGNLNKPNVPVHRRLHQRCRQEAAGAVAFAQDALL